MSKSGSPAPVQLAVMRHSLAEVVEAISLGHDIDAADRAGRTALFYAAQDGDAAIVAELIKHGANVNARDAMLETPLHFAARQYQPEIVRLLIDNGAQVDPQSVHGNTPLGQAVFGSRGRGAIIQLLLSAGADKALENKHGVSPESLARTIANYDVGIFFS